MKLLATSAAALTLATGLVLGAGVAAQAAPAVRADYPS
jgi:hypothetical protein